MKRHALILLSLPVIAWLANPVLAQSNATTGFEKLKSLVGEWQGTGPHGSINVSYQLVSGGSAVMETLMPKDEPDMITIYHLDGDKLMMTHYCSIGNQPRMQAEAPAGEIKKLNFVFVDVTNMAKPSAGHMVNLTLSFGDKDHFSQAWTWREAGKDKSSTFSFVRKK
jgi:hypothetical protein